MTIGTWIAVAVTVAGVLLGMAWRPRDDAVSDDWVREQIRVRGKH